MICPNCHIEMGIVSSEPDISVTNVSSVEKTITTLCRCGQCNYSESVSALLELELCYRRFGIGRNDTGRKHQSTYSAAYKV